MLGLHRSSWNPWSSCEVVQPKSKLLAGLKFEDPIALLQTPGADWDYCGAQELVETLTPQIKQIVENPADKQERPILLVLSAPGQGKSRFLQELPMLINKTEQVDRQLFPFLLTLENGLRFDGQFDTDPDKIIVARMLWQLLRNRRESGWAGLPASFTFSQLHRAVKTADLIVDDILDAMCKGEQLSAANYSILLALDGMQSLPGFDSPTDKTSLFYKTISKLCQLTTRDDGPLTIVAMTATVQLGVQFALADSPQKRHYVKLPLVDKVCRNGKAVFNFTGALHNEVLQLLQSDMDGHGRALEALEDACQHHTLENIDLLKDAVIRNLNDRYPNAVPADFEPILKAALSGQWLKREDKIGNFDPEKLQLVRLEYREDRSQRRIRLPYIWILLGVTGKDASPDLAKWSLDGYNEICKGPDAGGRAFEDFCARFRVLKSLCWPPNATVRLSDLHDGAILPVALRNVKVVNRHLKNAQAIQRMATNCRRFLLSKPGREQPAQIQRVQVQARLADGKMAELQDTTDQCSYVFLNAGGAPAADFAVLLQLDGQQGFLAECGQCKQGTAKVDLKNIQDERAKSCDENDFLLIICTDGQFNQSDLPHMTGIVQQEQWHQYFGPYAGRAFQAFRSSQRQWESEFLCLCLRAICRVQHAYAFLKLQTKPEKGNQHDVIVEVCEVVVVCGDV